MASPSLSSAIGFVKKYPIALCGLSLLFMPSVHHLLLYFTPLLLSTAIFVVAMVSWGPGASAENGSSDRRRPRFLDEDDDEWTFHESMADYDENEVEADGADAERAVAMAEEASFSEKEKMDLKRQEDLGDGDAHPDVALQQKPGEALPDLSKVEQKPIFPVAEAMGAAASHETCPSAEGCGEASPGSADCHACQAEPDPDVSEQSACVNSDADALHGACPALTRCGGNDDDAEMQHTNQRGSHASSHGHHHADGLRGVHHALPAQKPAKYLQVCA